MKTIPLNLLLLLLLLAGCTTSLDINQKFDDATFRYERALRWGNLQQAAVFQKHPQQFTDKELQRFKDIKITAYNIAGTTTSGNQIKQTAEIQYYKLDDMVVHTLMNHQVWEYDAEAGRWYLMSPIPTFK